MAGASRSPKSREPYRPCNSNQPSTAPGVETGSGPSEGIESRESLRNTSRFSDRGARPLAFRPTGASLSGSQIIANRSPPMPQPVGSVSPSTAFAAIAASTALPPDRSMSSPAWVANTWLVATIPRVLNASEREANGCPAPRS